jgi:hypothetical protein
VSFGCGLAHSAKVTWPGQVSDASSADSSSFVTQVTNLQARFSYKDHGADAARMQCRINKGNANVVHSWWPHSSTRMRMSLSTTYVPKNIKRCGRNPLGTSTLYSLRELLRIRTYVCLPHTPTYIQYHVNNHVLLISIIKRFGLTVIRQTEYLSV